jgi:site-specific DNA recombinase
MSEGKPKTRCAIYTRKSSEEGLEQEFNSLDAQYDACASYIASQKHEGWKLLSQRYDDGGISGGTMERPALQRLLSDIDAGLIDIVVIYKIDRLTRSLADFARLVERLEQRGCSFVSVTQAFNTSTSMGRLTLNDYYLLHNSNVRSLQSVFETRSPPPRRRASGWVGLHPWDTTLTQTN